MASVKGRLSFVLGSKPKFVAVIEEPDAIEKILEHIGLNPQPPPNAPTRRRVELFEVVEAALESVGISRDRCSGSAVARE